MVQRRTNDRFGFNWAVYLRSYPLISPEFKALSIELRNLLPPWQKPILYFLCYGLLYWLEQRYIDNKISTAMDIAVDEYHKEMDRLDHVNYPKVVITEDHTKPLGIDEMRITNPLVYHQPD